MEELARLREMNRARQKKHYDAKKDEINAKRRENRKKRKILP